MDSLSRLAACRRLRAWSGQTGQQENRASRDDHEHLIMNYDCNPRSGLRRRRRAFSIMEALVGMMLAGIMFVALYAGLAWSFTSLRLTRENLRATQILTEKMETIRLYTWEQLTVETNFLPTNFTATYYPPGETNSTGAGTWYEGRMTVTPVSFGCNYDEDMVKVTVAVDWTTGSLRRTRSLSTFVSQYGLQNYIW
jgi:type II secretory pathway pseudopilin PulG